MTIVKWIEAASFYVLAISACVAALGIFGLFWHIVYIEAMNVLAAWGY